MAFVRKNFVNHGGEPFIELKGNLLMSTSGEFAIAFMTNCGRLYFAFWPPELDSSEALGEVVGVAMETLNGVVGLELRNARGRAAGATCSLCLTASSSLVASLRTVEERSGGGMTLGILPTSE